MEIVLVFADIKQNELFHLFVELHQKEELDKKIANDIPSDELIISV